MLSLTSKMLQGLGTGSHLQPFLHALQPLCQVCLPCWAWLGCKAGGQSTSGLLQADKQHVLVIKALYQPGHPHCKGMHSCKTSFK